MSRKIQSPVIAPALWISCLIGCVCCQISGQSVLLERGSLPITSPELSVESAGMIAKAGLQRTGVDTENYTVFQFIPNPTDSTTCKIRFARGDGSPIYGCRVYVLENGYRVVIHKEK